MNSKAKNSISHASDFYNGYDYSEFWEGREYEDHADKIAVKRLLSLIDTRTTLVDLGAGTGRMIPLYEKLWKNIVLVDPSSWQLKETQKKISPHTQVKILIGTAENIPLPDASCDTVLCTRVFHYINNPARVVKEIHRVLELKGHLILEVPNKLHFKNRILSMFKRGEFFSEDEINIAIQDQDIVFVNHNPKTIKRLLEAEGIRVIETLSISNFRSAFLKTFLPFSFLIRIEKIVQKPFAFLWFGPSIYFLAEKIF